MNLNPCSWLTLFLRSHERNAIKICTASEYMFLDLNECDTEQPCENEATCINLYGGYSCQCGTGVTGTHCENGMMLLHWSTFHCRFKENRSFFADVDECISDPCRNGATCNNTVGSFVCDCLAGYTGELCEEGK